MFPYQRSYKRDKNVDVRPYPNFQSTENEHGPVPNRPQSWDMPHDLSSTNFQPHFLSPEILEIPDLQQWQTFDSDDGVFRPSNIIDNTFECVYVTTENIDDVLGSLNRSGTISEMKARLVMQTLESNPFIISNGTLDLLEALWTGNERHPTPEGSSSTVPQHTVIATFAYRVRFSKEWKVTRFLTCLAFDETAVATLNQYTGYKRGRRSGIFQHSPELGEGDAVRLIEYLQTGSMIDNFVSATKQKTRNIVKTESTGELDLTSSTNSLRVKDIVSKIHRATLTIKSRWSEGQPLRFSNQSLGQSAHEFQVSPPRAGPVQRQTPSHSEESSIKVSLRDEGFILLCSEPSEGGIWRRNTPIPPFCLFRMGLDQEPPDRLYQLEILAKIYKTGKVFFTCHDTNNSYSRALHKEDHAVVLQDNSLRLKVMSTRFTRQRPGMPKMFRGV